MKKLSLGFVLMLLVASIASCTKVEYVTVTPEEETDLGTYTIMMYGCGGENLDEAMVLNIQEALYAGATDRVNFTGQIKFSARFQQNDVLKGTQRFVVGEAGDMWYEPVEVMDSDVALYDPQVLADFIKWSKEQCPADNYVLILWNHGGGWFPTHDYYGQGESRAIVYDDYHGKKGLSLSNLVQGIKASDTKFKMVYFDACVMGMLEVVAGLGECTDYTMCASHITPGNGGDYDALMYHLGLSTNFEQSMASYCRETVAHWNIQATPFDLMLVNNTKIEPVLDAVKELAGYVNEVLELCMEYAENEDEVDKNIEYLASILSSAVNYCYNYDTGFPYYDIRTFAEILANSVSTTYSAKFASVASKLHRAMNEAIVCKQLSSVIAGMDLSMGVTLVDQEMWELFGYEEAYDTLYFQQRTGWGNWLAMNPIAPTNNPNPDTVVPGGGEDGDDGDGGEGGNQQPVDPEEALAQEIEHILNIIGKN
ncbi:MAG: hypothetical protein IKW52_03930 [Alistipes sp.]|nr:hypothetical protein [Alistipes sp.]